eukprot:Skav222102  [mRNA]  locus=scaffold2165:468111:469737:- [translate_table: standard]
MYSKWHRESVDFPHPCAETGAGGRIRDGESTGKGSLVVAAVAGYATGNLHIPGYKMPWEFEDFKYPSNMAPPLQAGSWPGQKESPMALVCFPSAKTLQWMTRRPALGGK